MRLNTSYRIVCCGAILGLLIMMSCKQENNTENLETTAVADSIVNLAIAKAGSKLLYQKEVCFDFRGKEYIAYRNAKKYSYQRFSVNDTAVTHDFLSKKGFKRYVNDRLVLLPDSLSRRYGNSVNSVHYFAYLPLGLTDPAVNRKYLGLTPIKGKTYHTLRITFDQKGGGDDFDDVYLYWIDTSTNDVTYLAYEFHVNGGGMRFREVYNPRRVEGIRFVDYRNYKPINAQKVKLETLPKLFEEGQLQLLSLIDLENIYVKETPEFQEF